jgi:dimethylamine monooxygenase subunit A
MQSDPILQPSIPDPQRVAATARLPAMQPVEAGAMFTVDSAYGAQLAEKARLIAERRDMVLRVLSGAEAAVDEVLEFALANLAQRPDFRVSGRSVTRPDGETVQLRQDEPLVTLSRLIQEDLCILERRGEEHVLTAALLCFPAAWTLSEKIGHPLTRIHVPVPVYDDGIARRVQRLFDGVQVGRPLWRANLLRYDVPDLYQPYTEAQRRKVGAPDSPYERSERQTVLRLPRTGAVVFAIHTTVIRRPTQQGMLGVALSVE